MSRFIFSTLSILALLLSGTNCSTVGGGGGGIQSCEVGLKLNPGDECRGSNYSIRNNDGELAAEGSYTKSCHIYVDQGAEFIDDGIVTRRYMCDDLSLTKDGDTWTIKSLPPPAATVR